MKVFFMKKYNVFIDFVKIVYLHAIELNFLKYVSRYIDRIRYVQKQ